MTYLEMAKRAGDREQAQYRSFSGADVAEAELYRLERLFWLALYNDPQQSIEIPLADFDAKWRAYAATNNAKVDNAPKIKRGPSSGHSVISYRWVSPELAQTKSIHLRSMVGQGMKPGRFDQTLGRIVEG